jgi:hypothetical protein
MKKNTQRINQKIKRNLEEEYKVIMKKRKKQLRNKQIMKDAWTSPDKIGRKKDITSPKKSLRKYHI